METLYTAFGTVISFATSILPWGNTLEEKSCDNDWVELDAASIVAEMKAEANAAADKATAEAIAYAYSAAKDAAELLNVMTGNNSPSATAAAVKKHKIRLDNMKRVLRTAEAYKAEATAKADVAAMQLKQAMLNYEQSGERACISTKAAVVTASVALREAMLEVKNAKINVDTARDILAKYKAHTAAY
jgi:hypothetical protein